MAVLYTSHFIQFLDDDGNPLAGGKLYTYEAGTTTPKATYTTPAASVQNANPVILDSAGRATVFIDGSYRFDLYDANDVLLESTDNVTSFTTLGDSADSFFESFSGDGSTVLFTLSEDLGTDEKTIMVYTEFEYTINGTFASDTGWTKGTGWTIGSGVATAVTATSDLEQSAGVTLQENETYTITYTITRSAGSVTPKIGGTSGTSRSSAGTYTENIIAGSTQAIAFEGSGFSGTVDNVSVRKISGAEVLPTSQYTLDGTSLTLTEPPATGTNNLQVWGWGRLAASASAAAAAAATSAANAATSAALSAQASGFKWDYSSTTTEADPTSGRVRFNNATLSSATEIYISHTTDDSQDVDDYIATWDDSTSTVGGVLRVFKQTDPTVYSIFNVTGTEADNTTWSKYTVGYVSGAGSLADGDALTIQFVRNGDKGDTGATGATGSVSATNSVVAATTAGASLKSSNLNDCLSWGAGGSANLTLNSNMSGASAYKIVNIIDPTSAQDVATKNYIDTKLATTTQKGIIELATQAEVDAGTDTTRAVTPDTLANYSGLPAQIDLVSAWVNFNGTGTVSIRDSLNVTSITDNGTGDYTVNFTTNFANTNYAFALSGSDGTDSTTKSSATLGADAVAVGSFNIRTGFMSSNTPEDTEYVCAIFYGDQ